MICERHGIGYYLAGGTLIGALRHGGFIPWDDDIDLYMPYGEWLKFRRAFESEQPKDRALCCSDIDPNFPSTIAKYTSLSTTAVHKYNLEGGDEAGIAIDIFILDPLPTDKIAQDEAIKALLLYAEFVTPYYTYSHRYRYESDYEHWRSRELEVGHETVVKELEAAVTKYSEDECDCFLMRWGGSPHVFNKELFGTPRMVPFDGMTLPAPEHSYLYLTQLYGADWINLPLHDNERTHDAFFNATLPFEEFRRAFGVHFDSGAYRKRALERKRHRIAMGSAYLDLNDIATRLQANALALETRKVDEKHDLGRLYDDGSFDKLRLLLDDYLTKQCSSMFFGHLYFDGVHRFWNPVYADIGDKLLWIVVELLGREGRLADADRLLTARQQSAGKLSHGLEVQRRVVDDQKRAADLIEQGEYDTATKVVEESLAEKPDWTNLIRMMLVIVTRWKPERLCEAEELLKRGKRVQPACGDWEAFEGDMLRDADPLAALVHYDVAKERTRNGFALHEIEKFRDEMAERVTDEAKALVQQGDTSSALDLVNKYMAHIDALSPHRLYLEALVEEQPKELARVAMEAHESAVATGELSYGRAISAVCAKAGLTGAQLDCAMKTWEAAVCRESMAHRNEEVLENSDNPLVLCCQGLYCLSQCDASAAFDCFYLAVDACRGTGGVSECLLKNIFAKDAQSFCDRLTERGISDTLHELRREEWYARHQSVDRWRSAILALGLDATGSQIGEAVRLIVRALDETEVA